MALRFGGSALARAGPSASHVAARWYGNSRPQAGVAAAPKVILVMVGDSGHYLDWRIKWETLKDMRAGSLLEELAVSKLFGDDLKGVKLGRCSAELFLLPFRTGWPDEAPDRERMLTADTSVEEVVSKALMGATSTDATAVGGASATETQLCIRVHVPASRQGKPGAAAAGAYYCELIS